MFLQLVEGAAFLLALTILQGFVWRLTGIPGRLRDVLSGLLFACITVTGIAAPLQLMPGVIFDARTVVLAMAGLFGGPVVAGIAGVSGALYRVFVVGGVGVTAGVSTIVLAVALGLGFRWLCRHGKLRLGNLELLGFGFLLHLGTLVVFRFTFPAEVFARFLNEVAVPYIVIFTFATLFLGWLLNDIERQIETERALTESQTRLRAIFERGFQFVGLLDPDGRLLEANSPALRFFGKTAEEVRGRYFWDTAWWDQDPALQDRARDAVRRAASGEFVRFETPIVSPDGRTMISDFSLSPVFDGRGDVVLLIPEARDITALKEAEEALRRSQKMDAVGQLSGGIAHDFNNMLNVIIGNLELIEMTAGDDEELRGRLDNAKRGALRAADLTRRLLIFSRDADRISSPMDAGKVVADMHDLLARSLTQAIDLKIHVEDGLWKCNVDPGDLQDAVVNLSLNARDAMPGGGELFIQVANRSLRPEDAEARPPSVPPGDYVMVSVGDNGVGMPKEIVERIFEPFFTTKESSHGTGLGLAMVYGFVERTKGHIDVQSEPGRGTTFRIYLPRAGAEPDDRRARDAGAREMPAGDETVLVVDDEADIAAFAETTLAQLGYKVLTAGDAAEALAAIDDNPGIDLLFSDVVMPGAMNGLQLACEARSRRPDLKVLLASGFTQKLRRGDEYGDLLKSLLGKPYGRADLAFAVRAALDGPATA